MILTSRLESERHATDQKTIFSAKIMSLSKNVSFVCFACCKRKRGLYTMTLMPTINSALNCCTHYHICTPFYKSTAFFTIVYVSRKNMYLILNKLKMSAISSGKFYMYCKVFCILPCCSWVLSKKEHVQIEHAGHHLYLALKSDPLLKKVRHFQGNNILCVHESTTETSDMHFKTAISWFCLKRSCILTTTLLSAVTCVLYLREHVKYRHAHVWNILCMLCTIAAPFKGDHGL